MPSAALTSRTRPTSGIETSSPSHTPATSQRWHSSSRFAPKACATSGSRPSSSPMANTAMVKKRLPARPAAPIASGPSRPTITVSTMPIVTHPSSAITTGVASVSIGRSSFRSIRYSKIVTFTLVLAVLLLPLVGTSDAGVQGQPETLSMLGEPLYAPSLSKDARAKADEEMRAAREAYDKTPNAVPAIVALARAHLALGRLGDTIEILT